MTFVSHRSHREQPSSSAVLMSLPNEIPGSILQFGTKKVSQTLNLIFSLLVDRFPRFMAQEAQHEPDSRLKIIERPVEDGDEEETNGGGDAGEEKNGGRGDTVDEVGCEDDTDEEDSEDKLRP